MVASPLIDFSAFLAPGLGPSDGRLGIRAAFLSRAGLAPPRRKMMEGAPGRETWRYLAGVAGALGFVGAGAAGVVPVGAPAGDPAAGGASAGPGAAGADGVVVDGGADSVGAAGGASAFTTEPV